MESIGRKSELLLSTMRLLDDDYILKLAISEERMEGAPAWQRLLSAKNA